MSESAAHIKQRASYFSDLEKEGGARASEADKPSKGDGDWMLKVKDASNEMASHYGETRQEAWRHFILGVASVIQSSYGEDRALKDVKKCEQLAKYGGGDVRRRDCPATTTYDALTQVDENWEWMWSEENSNHLPRSQLPEGSSARRCTFSKQLRDRDTYMLNDALNDLTACFHRSLEHFRTAVSFHKEGKCSWWE